MGPRAWSFWVEMPISAPSPNSKPSVKRVEALWYTAAASTPSRNFAAVPPFSVTMHSECRVPWAAMKSMASSTPDTTLTARM